MTPDARPPRQWSRIILARQALPATLACRKRGGQEGQQGAVWSSARLRLQARSNRALHRGLSGAHLRSVDGSHRSAHRGAGGDRGRSDPAAAGGRIGRGRRTRRSRARYPARALGGSRTAEGPRPPPRRRPLSWRRSQSPTRRGKSCCAMPPRTCGCRRAAITACCAWRVRSPISTAQRQSAGCISPRRCPTAHSRRMCGRWREPRWYQLAGNEFPLRSANHKARESSQASLASRVSCCVSRS